ncbi:MAG: CvpA family protein [Bacteroidota bacterium]|nr:CvpA family protein [Bacteroidota bacterium]
MNSTDIFILIVMGIGVVWGLRSGVVRQVLGLAGLIACFVLGFLFMETAGAFIATLLPIDDNVAVLVGFAGTFLAVQIVVMILIRGIQKIIGALKLGAVNRMIGGGVGALFSGLLLSIIFVFMAGFGVPSPQAQQASRFYGPISNMLPRTWEFATGMFPQIDGIPERFGLDPERLSEPEDT